MERIVDVTAPGDRFALCETMRACPEGEFDVLRAAASDDGGSMPLLWARAPDTGALFEQLRTDSSIDAVRELVDDGHEVLFEVEWATGARLPVYSVAKREATVLRARGSDETWHLRILFPDLEDVASTSEFCDRYDLDLSVASVRAVEDACQRGYYGLTSGQYDTLTQSYDAGYFDIPREDSLVALADTFEISHQALSERLRRALGTLVENTVAAHGPRGSVH